MKASNLPTRDRTTRSAAASSKQRSDKGHVNPNFVDLRPAAVAQRKLVEQIQRMPEEEELSALQPKMGDATSTVQRQADQGNGMPAEVQQKMESTMNADFSSVKIHPNSSSAQKVGALAYTQGENVHFAPGQFKPASTKGQQLLGHELAHVVQQRAGMVKPTTSVAGMAVNDDPGLESEADKMGNKAAQAKMELEEET